MITGLSASEREARNREIVNLYLEGKLTQQQIGERYGITGRAVGLVCKSAGLRIDAAERRGKHLRRNHRQGAFRRFNGVSV